MALLVLGNVSLAASGTSKEECEKVKVKIRAIEAKMRQGYTASQGIRYEQKLRELREKRYKLCQ